MNHCVILLGSIPLTPISIRHNIARKSILLAILRKEGWHMRHIKWVLVSWEHSLCMHPSHIRYLLHLNEVYKLEGLMGWYIQHSTLLHLVLYEDHLDRHYTYIFHEELPQPNGPSSWLKYTVVLVHNLKHNGKCAVMLIMWIQYYLVYDYSKPYIKCIGIFQTRSREYYMWEF